MVENSQHVYKYIYILLFLNCETWLIIHKMYFVYCLLIISTCENCVGKAHTNNCICLICEIDGQFTKIVYYVLSFAYKNLPY